MHSSAFVFLAVFTLLSPTPQVLWPVSCSCAPQLARCLVGRAWAAVHSVFGHERVDALSNGQLQVPQNHCPQL